MSTKQIPAKSAKSAKKAKPSIDELATSYKPPVVEIVPAPVPAPVAIPVVIETPACCAADDIGTDACSNKPAKSALPPLPAIEDVEIEDGIPLPGSYSGRDWLPLLKKMKPTQSATLTIRATPSLARSIIEANKSKSLGYFIKKRYPQAGIVRVWREV